MPIVSTPKLKLPNPDRRAYLDYMPGSDIPVIHHVRTWRPDAVLVRAPTHQLALFVDINNDPEEAENRIGGRGEVDMLELLKIALADLEAPEEQLERLGLG